MNKPFKKTITAVLIATMLLVSSATLIRVHADGIALPPPNWNVTGQWDLAYYCTSGSSDAVGNTFFYHITITNENSTDGSLTGTGYWTGETVGSNSTTIRSPAPTGWNIELSSSYVSGDSLHLHIFFTSGHTSSWQSTSDATIDANGHIVNGNWEDTAGSNGYPADNFGTVSSYNGQATQYPMVLTFPPGSNVQVTITSSNMPPSFGGDTSTDIQSLSSLIVYALPGIKTPYYYVSVTGTFTGQVEVCVQYDPTGLTLEQQKHLRLCIYDPVDFNHDGTVNGQDIALMQKAIHSGKYNPIFDINHDGKVNNADLRIVQEFARHGIIVNQGHDCRHEARLPWMDITTSVDTVNHYVCGVTDHFSGFGVH